MLYNNTKNIERCDYMTLLIDKTQLELLLEKKRDYIGQRHAGIDTLFAGASFGLSIICADFRTIAFVSGEFIGAISVLLAIWFCCRGIYMIVKDVNDKYGHKELCKDIEALNVIQHAYSIVAVKDTFNKYPNRFLLYYDERWNCKFFFNYKTVDNDEDNIKSRLSRELKIKENNISMQFKTEKIQKKYSVSHKEDRVYDHRVYYATISKYTDHVMSDEFEIDGKKFFWMSIQDMERDERIQEVNSDVVGLIKDTIG